MRFQDRVALITAAGSGIGRATAEIIGREGGVVVGVDTDKARLEEVVDGIRQGGGRAEAQVADALDGAKVAAAVEAVVRAHGRIDILVNAVGGSTIIERPAATADELTLEEWRRVIAFNLDGTFLFCHTVVPVMKRQRSGKIVNISSIAGRGVAANSSSAYAAAKGGIIAFTRKLSLELGPFGITVNAIAPSTHPDRAAARPPHARPDRRGSRAHSARAGGRGRGSGPRYLLPGLPRRRLRDRRDHRRERRAVGVTGRQGSGARLRLARADEVIQKWSGEPLWPARSPSSPRRSLPRPSRQGRFIG